MEIGTVVIAVISLLMVAMLTGLFIWLTDGWFSPGISVVLMGIGCVFLFTVFGWILFIALAVIGSALAGLLFMDSAE
jgi:hypothetical protein